MEYVIRLKVLSILKRSIFSYRLYLTVVTKLFSLQKSVFLLILKSRYFFVIVEKGFVFRSFSSILTEWFPFLIKICQWKRFQLRKYIGITIVNNFPQHLITLTSPMAKKNQSYTSYFFFVSWDYFIHHLPVVSDLLI